ncbi:MAG: hypothetical protein PVH50_00410 [Anaerolineae bacterium]|jgi:hypothetical protein
MSSRGTVPLFADLVFNEEGDRAKVVTLGGELFYAIPDNDFLRHVDATYIDRQIVHELQHRIKAMGDIVTDGVIDMLGEEHLFTRASIEHAIDQMDQLLEPDPVDAEQLRTVFWMSGLRAIVDVHGDVVRLEIPGWEQPPGR